jgi:hypothetical protein
MSYTSPCCPQGAPGVQGPPGVPGPPTAVIEFAHFYALAPPDNGTTTGSGSIGTGDPVDFPHDGFAFGDIVRYGDSDYQFMLTNPGTYSVFAQLSADNGNGQLVVALGGTEQAYTNAGTGSAGPTQIVLFSLVTTTVSTILNIQNSSSSGETITVSQNAGYSSPPSSGSPNAAQLIIQRIA